MLSAVLTRLREASGEPLYRPLADKRTIRLLLVVPDPSPGSPGFRLVLEHFKLGDAPPFDVLSYTRLSPKYHDALAKEWAGSQELNCREFDSWVEEELAEQQEQGDQTSVMGLIGSTLQSVAGQTALPPTSVRVNHGRLAVHEEVFRFLKFAHLKAMYRPGGIDRAGTDSKTDVKGEDIYLWVDNICLNQKDTAEMSAQCAHLGDIYKASRRCLVWLGPHQPPPSVRWAMDEFAPRCIQMAAEKGPDYIWREDALAFGTKFKSAFGDDSAGQWVSALLHVWSLFGRHCYFAEGWTQEVLLSPNVRILCGDCLWDWTTFEELVILTAPAHTQAKRRRLLNEHLRKHVARWGDVIKLIKRFRHIRQWWLHKSAESRTQDLVGIFGPLHGHQEAYCQISMLAGYVRGRKFLHKRDNIYGWLSLSRLCLRQGSTFGSPNYALPTEVVFTRFAQALAKGMPALDILNHVEGLGGRKLEEGLPSWVPDFSVEQSPVPLLRFNHEALDARFDATNVRARRHSTERIPRVDEGKLVVYGVQLDTLWARGPHIDARSGIANRPCIEWFLERCLESGETYTPTNQPVQEALSLTLVAGGTDVKENTRFKECFQDVWTFFITNRLEKCGDEQAEKLLGLVDQLGARAGTEQTGWIPATRKEWEARRADMEKERESRASYAQMIALLKLIALLGQDRAPLMSQKKYFGLCSIVVKRGDAIWLLEGGRTPYILRKDKDGSYRLIGEAYVHGFMHGEGWTKETKEKMQCITIR